MKLKRKSRYCWLVWNDGSINHLCRRRGEHTHHMCPCGATHIEPNPKENLS